MRAALYIHIPFCKSKCSYCDFFSLPTKSGVSDEYIDCLQKEALYRAQRFSIESWKTVYIGGGTPSLLTPAQITRLMDGIRAAAPIDYGAEVTIEANPDTVTLDFLRAARTSGINRLSLGVQSLDDKVLKCIGRIATRDTVLKACALITDVFCKKTNAPCAAQCIGVSAPTAAPDAARGMPDASNAANASAVVSPSVDASCVPDASCAAQNAPRSPDAARGMPDASNAPDAARGMPDASNAPEALCGIADASGTAQNASFVAPRFSVDLIAGLPYQSEESFLRDIEFASSCGADHVSLYALTLEEQTPLFTAVESGAVTLPDGDVADTLWLTGRDVLEQAGFMQYEVSNFAKRGFESAHNLSYWKSEPYVGIGAGATGTVDSYRYTNKCDITAWMQGFACDEESLDKKTRLFEFCMMGFRLRNGIHEEELFRRFGVTKEALNPVFDCWVQNGKAAYQNKRLFLTKDGILFLNAFLTELAEYLL